MMSKKHLVLVAVFAASVSAIAGEGGNSSGGGSVVRNDQGELVPADTYFKARHYKLPNSYLRKLTEADYPLLQDEMRKVGSLLRTRTRNPNPLPKTGDRTSVEIYLTETLSGDDLLPVEAGLTAQQVSYTYAFRELSDDFSVNRIRRIIEIKPSIFDKLTARNQALIILHEMLHHESIGGHEVISPIIQSMSTLLAVRDRQHAGDRNPISEAEYQASVSMENLAKAINDCEPDQDECLTLHVNRRGGGLDNLESKVSETNFVGVDSVIWVGLGTHRNGDAAHGFKNNVVIDSDMKIDASGESGCVQNLFESVAVDVQCNSTRSSLQNIQGHSSKVLLGDDIWLKNLRLRSVELKVEQSSEIVDSTFMDTSGGSSAHVRVGKQGKLSRVEFNLHGGASSAGGYFTVFSGLSLEDRIHLKQIKITTAARQGDVSILRKGCTASGLSLKFDSDMTSERATLTLCGAK
jgi:hypothetical protein